MKKITLNIIDGLGNEALEYEELIYSILEKHKNLPFKDVLFLTSNNDYKNNNFIVKYVPKISYPILNKILFQELYDFYNFEYIMTIHLDGFPINNHLWTDEYLECDYIGAPWPSRMGWCRGENLVGNGGFSLRSKKLYQETKKIKNYLDYFFKYGVNEDVFISSYDFLREYLESKNIKFPSVQLAKQFSVEIPIDETHTIENSFGFHGKSYLEKLKN
jgi:hypothetical protein